MSSNLGATTTRYSSPPSNAEHPQAVMPTSPRSPDEREMTFEWAGGLVVGSIIGTVVGTGLAVLALMAWYQGHCGQVPFMGGIYCR
jgi:hypothetical protein